MLIICRCTDNPDHAPIIADMHTESGIPGIELAWLMPVDISKNPPISALSRFELRDEKNVTLKIPHTVEKNITYAQTFINEPIERPMAPVRSNLGEGIFKELSHGFTAYFLRPVTSRQSCILINDEARREA